MSKCYWKTGSDRLAQKRVAKNLQFVKKKNAISLKHNKAKCNNTRCACSCSTTLMLLLAVLGHSEALQTRC